METTALFAPVGRVSEEARRTVVWHVGNLRVGYLLEGALGALADGGEARVATDLIHGVKKNAPIYCEIGHCDHNDVLFMVVAFRGAEKSVVPLSERTAASTITCNLTSAC